MLAQLYNYHTAWWYRFFGRVGVAITSSFLIIAPQVPLRRSEPIPQLLGVSLLLVPT